MAKDVVTTSTCRSRLYIILFGIFVIILVLHAIIPGNLTERTQAVTKHLDYILPRRIPFDIDFVNEHLYELDQSDPLLIEYVRIKHLTPPSKLPYNLNLGKKKKENFRDDFSKWVSAFFKDKRNGTFIEAGAHDGGKGSHTLYLERSLGWTGLLIECNPMVVPYLKSKHRKAWVADVCIAPTTTPGILNFSNPAGWSYSGTFRQPWNISRNKQGWTFFDVQTVPMYTVLAALGWTEIDYFSFDIEGAELSVLQTLPFDRVIFKVLIIEVYFYTAEEKQNLNDLLTSNGYYFVKDFHIDKIYVHESVKHMLGK